jgi:hypothetical protein
MKISNKQILMLYQIVLATCPIVSDIAFSQKDRIKLVEKILNQQDDELKENETHN